MRSGGAHSLRSNMTNRFPSKLESIDEVAPPIMIVADEMKSFKKFGALNRGSMLPSIPFGKVGKINNSKAMSSRLHQTSHKTMVALGIITKAGKRRVL